MSTISKDIREASRDKLEEEVAFVDAPLPVAQPRLQRSDDEADEERHEHMASRHRSPPRILFWKAVFVH